MLLDTVDPGLVKRGQISDGFWVSAMPRVLLPSAETVKNWSLLRGGGCRSCGAWVIICASDIVGAVL